MDSKKKDQLFQGLYRRVSYGEKSHLGGALEIILDKLLEFMVGRVAIYWYSMGFQGVTSFRLFKVS